MRMGDRAKLDKLKAELGWQRSRRAERENGAIQKTIARATCISAGATIIIALATCVYVFYASKQWQAIKAQVDEMQAERRPWIKISEVKISGPLEFWTNNDIGIMPLHFSLQNVGHSPAFNIQVQPWSFIRSPKHFDLFNEQNARCTALKTPIPAKPVLADNPNAGSVLFPGDSLSYDETAIDLRPDKIKAGLGTSGNDKAFDFWIYGCVDYIFGEPAEHHQTPFVYRVYHLIESMSVTAMDYGFIPGETVPIDKLRLEPKPLATGRPD